MLADLLPGLRELRGPLAAGYLWLLFGWLVAEDDFSRAGGVVERLVELGGGLSDVAVAAAASFAAYLIGSLSEDLFGRGLSALVREFSSERVEWSKAERWRARSMSPALIESQIKRFENSASRLSAESGLRVAILPPLTAILVYLIVEDAWWWLWAGVLVPALLVQAYLRTRDYLIASRSLFELRNRVGLPPESASEMFARTESGQPSG